MKSILLAGGSGTRLWPLSRSTSPKQFVKLPAMEHTLFQMVYLRCLELSKPEEIYIVCGAIYKPFIVRDISELGIEVFEQNILLEPQAKNTLPAITYAVVEIHATGDDVVGVFPTDHIIADPIGFTKQIAQAIPVAEHKLVTFGIVAKHPETGYGYIKPGKSVGDVCFTVDSFREKPNKEVAEQYVRDGYFWNSGMFMFHSKLFLDELAQYAPEVYKAFKATTVQQKFELSPKISIDFGLLEKTANIAVLPLNIRWNDLGNYPAFIQEYGEHADETSNIAFNEEIFVDAENNLVFSDSSKVTAVVGTSDLVIVDQPDALLICSKEAAQKVKDVVDQLVIRKDIRAQNSNVAYTSWGTVEKLSSESSWTLHKILANNVLSIGFVKPGFESCVTLLQGDATITLGSVKSMLKLGIPYQVSAEMSNVTIAIQRQDTQLLMLHTNCTQVPDCGVYKEL